MNGNIRCVSRGIKHNKIQCLNVVKFLCKCDFKFTSRTSCNHAPGKQVAESRCFGPGVTRADITVVRALGGKQTQGEPLTLIIYIPPRARPHKYFAKYPDLRFAEPRDVTRELCRPGQDGGGGGGGARQPVHAVRGDGGSPGQTKAAQLWTGIRGRSQNETAQ